MTWFLIAIIGPVLYAMTNHIDKILLEKYFKEGGVGTLILFSSLLSALAIPFLFLGDPTVLDVDLFNVFILGTIGLINIMLLWLYLMALKDDEASIIIVFYQLVPVIALILGYFILGEVLTKIQLIAMAIIILGTSIVSFDVNSDNKFKLRTKTIYYMTGASFLWALSGVIFKYVALEENVWRSLFWEHVVLVIVGAIIYFTIPTYRKHFKLAIKNNSKSILVLNFTNEALFLLGNFAVAFAYLLAPVSLVLLTESFQPIFVFIIGLFLTLFFPHISSETINLKHFVQKLFAIIITGIGTIILLSF